MKVEVGSGVVVGLVSSSLGLPHRHWACCVVVGLVSLSLGLPHCCPARCIVVGLVLLLSGLPHCHSARCAVVGLVLSSLCLPCRRACIIIVVSATLLFSLLHRHWACHIIQLTVSSLGSGIIVGLLRWRDDENEVRCATRSVTVPRGSPSARASPLVSTSSAAIYDLPRSAHMPGQGEGRMTWPCCIQIWKTQNWLKQSSN